jgi:hypothetical protein
MTTDSAGKLYTLGRYHGMGANRLWARALEEAVDAGEQDIEYFAFNGPFSPSINILTGLSFELLLKAAYVAKGGCSDDAHLRNEIGHNLVSALDRATSLGFNSKAPHLREIIELINDPYRRHYFRYDPQDVPLPEFQHIKDALVALEAEVKELCTITD